MSDAIRDTLQHRLGAHYAIESLLGQGGMGSVYRARDLTLDRPVAIKVITGDVGANPELKERFLREARTVAKLRHPNIVQVYSAGEADGLLYFVMELVPGESLRELLSREGTVDAARAERILHELALALDYAHAQGIVHRDVKPENILLDRDTGRAMLTDFGVARALESNLGGNITGTGMILGSPRYMSPEQASGEVSIDGRSDLYALALVGYEMFTGKPVVESGNVAGMLVKHLTETPKPLAEVAPEVPEGSSTAIDRALAKNRDERWRTGREMAEVIGMAWTPSGVTPAGGVSGGTGTIRGAGVKRARNRLVVGVSLAVVAVAIAMLVVWQTNGPSRAEARRSYAVVPFDIQSGNADVQWLRDGAVNMLTLALSQWTDVRVVDYERTLTLVREERLENSRVDLGSAQKIARRGGAGRLVMGQVATTADSLLVTARIYDVRGGTVLTTVTRTAPLAADPRPVFDNLARYLLDVAGVTAGPDGGADLASVTTTSLRAYRAYVRGVQYLNSWQREAADTAFRAAIRADSSFALAWYKRSLALGWGDGTDSAYVGSARRAAELADRLPPRAQALVRANYNLVLGLSAQIAGDTSGNVQLREAQNTYRDLLARDSLVAEAWYGLGDAYFHESVASRPPAEQAAIVTASMRAFNRTLALDSTFHLAYSHLVEYYGAFAQGNGLVLSGDSVLALFDTAAVRRFGGTQAVLASRRRAADMALAMTLGWVRSDADAQTPYLSLARTYMGRAEPDSAVVTIERALARPALNTPDMRLTLASMQLAADDARAFQTVRDNTTRENVAALKRANIGSRLSSTAASLYIAGSVGNGAELDRLAAYFTELTPTYPFTQMAMGPILQWYTTGMKVAVAGRATPEQRRTLLAGLAELETMPANLRTGFTQAAAGTTLAVYLATRDTVFSRAFRTMMPPGTTFTDVEALEALARGDTARARTLAQTYTHPDSLRSARFSMAGMRAIARAEVLATLGNVDWAIGYYEALDPARFTTAGLAEPGFAAYTGSFAARARLYEERGEPAKALAAWDEFLKRTENGDQLIEPQRRDARAAVRRLRDGGVQ